MELEEAKKVLMNLSEYNQDRDSKEYKAIDTVISELVALQELLDEYREDLKEFEKENEGLKCVIETQTPNEEVYEKYTKKLEKERDGIYADYQDLGKEYSKLQDEYERLETFKNEVKQIKRDYPSLDIDDCVNLAHEIDLLLKGEETSGQGSEEDNERKT